jgi:hypothetical protein
MAQLIYSYTSIHKYLLTRFMLNLYNELVLLMWNIPLLLLLVAEGLPLRVEALELLPLCTPG